MPHRVIVPLANIFKDWCIHVNLILGWVTLSDWQQQAITSIGMVNIKEALQIFFMIVGGVYTILKINKEFVREWTVTKKVSDTVTEWIKRMKNDSN